MDTLDFLNREERFSHCPRCGGLLKKRKVPEDYYVCTICGEFWEVTEAYLVEDTYWQYVQYDEIIFTDPEDFSLGKSSVSKEALKIPKKKLSDPSYLVEMLRDMDYLEADCEYKFDMCMHDVLVRTEEGYPVGSLRRWSGQDEEPEDEDEDYCY